MSYLLVVLFSQKTKQISKNKHFIFFTVKKQHKQKQNVRISIKGAN